MGRELMMVPVGKIDDNEYKMRLSLDDEAMEELIRSIQRDGILVPILLCGGDDNYKVVAGHRRFAAAVKLGLNQVPAYVDSDDTGKGWQNAFAENLFRQDLSPIEESGAIKDCLESGDYDIEGIARALGRSIGWIEDRILISEWPEDVQIVVHTGAMSTAAARNLAKIDDEMHRKMLINYGVENGVTARVTAAWLQAWHAGKVDVPPADIQPADAAELPAPMEPYTPCVICARKLKMIELRYCPVCAECSPMLVEISREFTTRGDQVPAG